MKKERKVIAVVLVALIVFLLGFGLGSTKGIKIDVNVEGGSAPVAATNPPTTTPPTTTPPTTTPPASEPPASGDASAPSGDASAPSGDASAPSGGGASTGVPSTKEEIVAKYNEVINAAKKEQNVKIHKVVNTQITVTDAPAMKDQINSIVQGLVKPSDDTFTITNGAGVKDSDQSPADPNGIITPSTKEVALKPEGVKEATATPAGDGYTMVITLNEEKSTFDGTNTVNPVHHESCLAPLNLATLELPMGAKISQADMTYPGATLTVTVNGDGKVTKYDVKLPMSGSGSGKLVVSLTVGLEGSMDETYEFTY